MVINAPVHPRLVVKEDRLKTLGLTVTDAAGKMGVGRPALPVEIAYRLSKPFSSTPNRGLRMQLAYDLAQSRDLDKTIRVGGLKVIEGAFSSFFCRWTSLEVTCTRLDLI